MGKLQQSYTTREQSQKLIELGLPMDSADFFYRRHPRTPFIVPDGKTITEWFTTGILNSKKIPEDVIPCWSVGRLIEIINNCMYDIDKRDKFYAKLYYHQNDLFSFIMLTLKDNEVDFSKLEE